MQLQIARHNSVEVGHTCLFYQLMLIANYFVFPPIMYEGPLILGPAAENRYMTW